VLYASPGRTNGAVPRGHHIVGIGVGCLVMGPWLLACAGVAVPGIGVPTPEADVLAAVEGLEVVDGSFAEVDCDAHGPGLAYVATVEDPARARAALLALATCLEAAHRSEAVMAGLAREEPEVAGAALAAAAESLAEASAEDPLLSAVAVTLVEHPDKGVRYEAVEALDRYPWSADPAMSARMHEAVRDPAPPVVSELLHRAHARAAGLAEPLGWLATARFAMQAHLDPGIRGRAALLAARLAPDSPQVRRQLRSLLTDKHPYTRAAAATALADCGDLASVHLLVELLDDKEISTWKMLPFQGSDGVMRRQVHKGSHFERVNDAVFRAIEELTSGMDDGYSYRSVSLKYLELDLISARRDALKWYDDHRDALPPLGADEGGTD